MPELPEVEVTRQGLLQCVPGRLIKKISSSNKRLRLPVPRKRLVEHVLDQTIRTIDRRAKYLLFRLSNGSSMVIHLGMTGKLSVIESKTLPNKHDHLRLLLDDGHELRFNDSRRFGSIIVWPTQHAESLEVSFSAGIGVEPFSRNFTVSYLLEKSRRRKLPVKNFLMDSRLIAGIGNIYANEILFATIIHPLTPVGSLTKGQWKKIITATRQILNKAIQAGGSTISDFLSASGNPGYFQFHFKAYKRDGEKCQRCSGTISKIVVGGRASYFCPQCQVLS